MDTLSGIGTWMLIGLFIGLIITIIALFFGDIILFDSIAFAILVAIILHNRLHIHPAISIIIGIVAGVGLFSLQKTKVGFWIICGILSLSWGFIFSTFAYEISNKDMIWTYVIFALGTFMMFGLHIRARRRTARTRRRSAKSSSPRKDG